MTTPTRGETQVIVVMGVAGAGKTTVGLELAQAVGWEFHDADDFHSPQNIAKMHRGEPLTDEDRAPWLAALHDLISQIVSERRHGVVACSALKQAYRNMLVGSDIPGGVVRFAYLDVPADELRDRLARRQHHFAPPALLDSQLATLEPPRDAVWVDGRLPVADEVRAIREACGVRRRAR
jgi:gluconokinase